jgi:ribosome-binding factor A
MPSIRQARVGEMIKRDLAEILQKEITDPRLALVSITGVDVAQDFSIAKVFISAIGDESEKMAALKALQGAAGFLRGRLGHMLDLRTVPKLAFRYDAGVERGVRMFELLRDEERNFTANPTGDAEEKPEGEALPELTEEDFAVSGDGDSEPRPKGE